MSQVVDSFIDYFESYRSNTNKFDFGFFFRNELANKSPTYKWLDYNCEKNLFVAQLRDCIIKNLNRNQSFRDENLFSKKSIKKLYEILKETKFNATEEQSAQLLFLLAFCKAKTDLAHFESTFFLSDSIEIALKQDRLEELDKLDLFHKILISLSSVHELIIDTCNEILEMRIAEINLADVGLKYFDSHIIGLNGFSGRDIIYISQSEIRSLISVMNEKQFSSGDQLTILKLNFFRLFIHESAHLVIRKSSNNMNISTPELLSESQKKKYSKFEAGFIIENKAFNDFIDWEESVKEKDFNLEPCKLYLDQLISNKIGNFDPKLAHTVKRQSIITNCDLNFKKAVDYE
ncbi:unnamed protein product [Brachionus calyciflorus]|uniref:Uncharacterized protein n=1 Tax=Brachionus calyciflorus TaxID=104777 RepID=A0A814GE02_9BILA|nr:unnamed protein product [Brachionus calyciflorus]